MSGPGDRASKHPSSREPTQSDHAEGQDVSPNNVDLDEAFSPGSQSSARAHMPHARKPGDLEGTASGQSTDAQTRQGVSRNPSSQPFEESDAGTVPTCKKSTKTRVTPVESMEGRPAADEEIRSRKRTPDAESESCAKLVERIGQRAREKVTEPFTNLLSHIKVPLLKEAYSRIRKDAAPGIDGETWTTYGAQLDVRLHDLEGRVQRGGYHPQPVRRVYIPKADGKRRPLGIPALEAHHWAHLSQTSPPNPLSRATACSAWRGRGGGERIFHLSIPPLPRRAVERFARERGAGEVRSAGKNEEFREMSPILRQQ